MLYMYIQYIVYILRMWVYGTMKKAERVSDVGRTSLTPPPRVGEQMPPMYAVPLRLLWNVRPLQVETHECKFSG